MVVWLGDLVRLWMIVCFGDWVGGYVVGKFVGWVTGRPGLVYQCMYICIYRWIDE